MVKNLVSDLILAHLAQIWAAIFFLNLAPSFTRCHCQQSSCTISEKIIDPILRKLSDNQMNRQMDRWMRMISWM